MGCKVNASHSSLWQCLCMHTASIIPHTGTVIPLAQANWLPLLRL